MLCGAGRPEMRRSFAMRPGLLADGTTSATSSSSSTTWASRSLGRRRVRAPAPLGYGALEVLLLAGREDLVLDPASGLKTFFSSDLIGEMRLRSRRGRPAGDASHSAMRPGQPAGCTIIAAADFGYRMDLVSRRACSLLL